MNNKNYNPHLNKNRNPALKPLFFIKTPALYVLLFLSASCSSPSVWKANIENEKGIALYNGGNFENSSVHFLISSEFEYHEEVPLYNNANSLFSRKQYSKALEFYDMAVETKYDFPQAWFNKGCTLFEWGKNELDPDFCSIERTVTLWEQAVKMFDNAVEYAGKNAQLRMRAESNREYIYSQIETVKTKNRENAELCSKKNESSSDNDEDSESEEQQSQDSQDSEDNEDQNQVQNDDSDSGGNDNQDIKDNSGGSNELSASEENEIQEELNRIGQRQEENGFYQTENQQFRRGELEKGDLTEDLWW